MPADQRISRRARTTEAPTTRRHTSLTPKVAVARRGHHLTHPVAPVAETVATAPAPQSTPALGFVSPRAAVAPRGSVSVAGLAVMGHALRATRRFAA